MTDCPFCRIASGELAARIAYQDEQVTAFHDLHPAAPVHVLLVPNRHLSGVGEIAAEDEPVLGHLLRVAGQVVREQGVGESGYRLVINTGPDAGQVVMHLHLHLLGGRGLGWPPG